MKDLSKLENEAINIMEGAFVFANSKRKTFADADKFRKEINDVKSHKKNEIQLNVDVCYAKSYIEFYPAINC
jgi:hypothetical protein